MIVGTAAVAAFIFAATASGFTPSTCIKRSSVGLGSSCRASPILQASNRNGNLPDIHWSQKHPLTDPMKEEPVSPSSNQLSRISSIVAITALAILVQLPLAPPSEANSFGQFSNEVNPSKIAPIVGRGNAQKKLQVTCERVGSRSKPIKSKNVSKNVSKRCSVIVEDPSSIRALEHELAVENLAKEPAWFNYAAAFSGSVISTLIIHPLDTIKVRIMAKGKERDDDLGVDYAGREEAKTSGTVPDDLAQTLAPNLRSNKARERSPLVPIFAPKGTQANESTALASAATTVYLESGNENEGLLSNLGSLYNGVLPNIVKEGPPSALYLGLYESSVIFLKQNPFFAEHNILMYLLAGAFGELIGSIVRAPAEAVKTRVQTGYTINNALETVLFTDDGRANTFKAWSSSCFRDVPHGAIQIAIFEGLKLFLISTPYVDIDVETLLSECLLAGIAGGIGGFLTTPADRVTTTIISSNDKDISALDSLRNILNEEGPSGLFVGWPQRTLYWFFAVGIFLSAYCALRKAAIPLFL